MEATNVGWYLSATVHSMPSKDPNIETPLVSIVVPVFNEESTLRSVLEKLLELPLNVEIIVSDDGSSDSSLAIARDFGEVGVKSISAVQNRGKGHAIRSAFAVSTGEVVIVQDADLEYDPVDIPHIIDPILRGVADVVYGTRFRGGKPQRVHLYWHSVGNRFLTTLTNVLFNSTLSDMEVGYKAFSGSLIRSFEFRSDDFRIEPEMTAGVLSLKNLRIYEVPISYYGRSFDEGKKITWRDGYRAVSALIQFRLRPPTQRLRR